MNTKTTFEKTIIGGIESKNRIVRSATHEGTGEKGNVSEQILEMHSELAKGDVGVIITGWISVSETDNPGENTVVLKDDTPMPGLKKWSEIVHKYGSRIVAQLNYAGGQLFYPPDGTVYGASDVADPISGIKPTPFTEKQIETLVSEFGDAALRTKNAGFDGVQIHAAHGYLFSKFLSPAFNKRTDAYGGTPLKNARIVLETLKDIKTKCGDDYPVWVKLNCSDFDHENGLDEQDFLIIANELAKNKIDAIEVSGGTLSGKYRPSRSKKYSAYHLEYAEKLMEQVSVPVIPVGGIRDIDTIDRILATTDVAAVSMCRPLIREPGLVKRWKDGDRRAAECVACNGCYNPKGTRCFFKLNKEEQAAQKEIMKFMNSMGKK